MDNTEYKKLISESLTKLDDSDNRFLDQILTLIVRHLERKGKHE